MKCLLIDKCCFQDNLSLSHRAVSKIWKDLGSLQTREGCERPERHLCTWDADDWWSPSLWQIKKHVSLLTSFPLSVALPHFFFLTKRLKKTFTSHHWENFSAQDFINHILLHLWKFWPHFCSQGCGHICSYWFHCNARWLPLVVMRS